ncbi:MAG TPA: DUF5076 domain-containing protein [Rhizomicrobium sp.]|jgi:hypothetical protein|nr:DUF5076 domain-containing protein [Rhizomicrobium sp.]
MNELPVPDGALQSKDADEFIRFWVVEGSEMVSLNVGCFGRDEAGTWGMMIADLSVHIVRALMQKGFAGSEDELRAQIEQGYLGRLSAKGIDHSGSLIGTRN